MQKLFYKIAPNNNLNDNKQATLILLHGRGTNENDLLELSNHLDNRLDIVSIRAPFKYHYGGYTWFELNDKFEIDYHQAIHSSNLLVESLDNIKQHNKINSNKIFLFGFSMGAMLALITSLIYPQLFHGVIAHSGFLPINEKLIYQWDKIDNLNFYISHGVYDQIIPLSLAKETTRLFQERSDKFIFREYPIGHTISEESINDIIFFIQTCLQF